jgi:hypothetical protein
MAIVYQHRRLDTGDIFYIGIGLTEKRAFTKKGRNTLWKNIVSKSQYEVEILIDNISWEEACKKEKEFIALHGRKDLNTGTLCNLTCGGDGVINLSNEARHRIGNGNRGISRTEDVKKKIGSKNKGRKVSKSSILRGIETKRRNGTLNRSAETKIKLALANNKAVIGWKKDEPLSLVEYPSIKIAQEKLNIRNISLVCNGYCKTAGGYFWKFK